MHSARWGRLTLVVCLLCLVSGGLLAADPRSQFASETGLDIDLINLVQVDVNGTELTVVFVYITDRTFSSSVSPTLRERLLPYRGLNAFYVNPSVESVVAQFEFSPLTVSAVQPGGESFTPGLDDWEEITPGFLGGRFEVNPGGPDKGSGSEGILILGERIDPARPFALTYRGQRAEFEIRPTMAQPGPTATGSPLAASSSHAPIDVVPLQDVSGLQDVLSHDDFSAETMATFLGIDPELVRATRLDSRGEELRMLFVRLEAGLSESLLGSDLIEAIEPVVGTGAIMVWAFSPPGADFSPWHFYVQQSGTNYVFFSSASFVELTTGFLRTTRIDAGAVVAGVVRLPKSVDSSQPFTLFYGTSGVSYP